jgi:hypothetical protein
MSKHTDFDSQSEQIERDSDSQSIDEYIGSNLYYNKYEEEEDSDIEQVMESRSKP